MSETTPDPSHESGGTPSESDDERHMPSTEQDVASGQPYDPRQDPGPDGADDESDDEGPTDG